MLKRSVQTICAVMLMAGTAVAVTAIPAPALNLYVHGNIQCQVQGSVRYSPPLSATVGQNTRAIIKGTLSNCTDGQGTGPAHDGGETGVGTTRITGGKFKVITNYFSGDCTHTVPPDITMQVKWLSSTGTRVRDTWVSWFEPFASSVEPYQYQYAGATIRDQGVAGSYLGANAGVSFLSDGFSASGNCATKLKTPWTFGANGASLLSFLSPPTVDDVSPNSAAIGTSNLNVAITGMDFAASDTVAFSGGGVTVNSTTYISPTQIDANISIGSGAAAGMRDVTVSNSTLGSGTCTSCFMVSPIVSSVAPGVAQGATNKNVTITGLGFANGAVASVAPSGEVTVNYTQYINSTTLVANLTVAGGATLGGHDVTVTGPNGGVGTCTGCLTVNAGPTVTSTTPSSRGGGATNQVVAVNGTNFGPGAVAAFGGGGITVNSTTYVSPTKVNANISIADGAAIGARSVSVINTDGGTGQCAACFTVNKTPHITDWQVIAGPSNHWKSRWYHHDHWESRQVNGFTVQIVGTGFVNGATVSYSTDDIDINSTTFVSSTKIKMNIDIDVLDFAINGLPEDRAITITNPDGGSYTCQGCIVLLV